MSYQLELRHIRYFLAVAEELHFRKAAERLFISQPGLSKQIKEMERGLGLVLFERHNRKVKLTKAGAYLQSECLQFLKRLDGTLQQARLIHEGKVGELKFGYVGSAMQQIIPNLLRSFQQVQPHVLYSLREMDNQIQIEGLLTQEIDIGFVRLDRVPRGLQIYPVLKEPFCLVLPQQHPVTPSNFQSIAQLKEESFILFDPAYSPSYYEKVMQIFDDGNFSPLITHSTIHSSSIFRLVENSFGVSIVPRSLVMEEWPGIKFIQLKRIRQQTVLSAIWNTDNRNPVLPDVLLEIKKLRP